jgi:molybdopterin synthase sulfur carrier subunit
MANVVVRYFAAARSAAGVPEETVTAGTVEECLAAVRGRHGADLDRVLRACSLLLDGQAVKTGTQPLHDAARLDVLPPFAGG